MALSRPQRMALSSKAQRKLCRLHITLGLESVDRIWTLADFPESSVPYRKASSPLSPVGVSEGEMLEFRQFMVDQANAYVAYQKNG